MEFVKVLQTREGWSDEWLEICREGMPLPNEAMFFSELTPKGAETFCVVPVVEEKEVVCMVFYDVVEGEHGETTFDAPLVLDHEGIDKDLRARRLLATKMHEQWAENGYKLEIELSPLPRRKDETRHGQNESYFDFTMIYSLYTISMDICRILHEWTMNYVLTYMYY